MKKTRLVYILICLLAALALSSCMGREGADTTTDLPLTTTVTVTDVPVPTVKLEPYETFIYDYGDGFYDTLRSEYIEAYALDLTDAPYEQVNVMLLGKEYPATYNFTYSFLNIGDIVDRYHEKHNWDYEVYLSRYTGEIRKVTNRHISPNSDKNISDEDALKIASEIAKEYLDTVYKRDISVYTEGELYVKESGDYKEYSITFKKYVGRFETSDYITVYLSCSGELYTLEVGAIGVFDNIDPSSIDEARVHASQAAFMESKSYMKAPIESKKYEGRTVNGYFVSEKNPPILAKMANGDISVLTEMVVSVLDSGTGNNYENTMLLYTALPVSASSVTVYNSPIIRTVLKESKDDTTDESVEVPLYTPIVDSVANDGFFDAPPPESSQYSSVYRTSYDKDLGEPDEKSKSILFGDISYSGEYGYSGLSRYTYRVLDSYIDKGKRRLFSIYRDTGALGSISLSVKDTGVEYFLDEAIELVREYLLSEYNRELDVYTYKKEIYSSSIRVEYVKIIDGYETGDRIVIQLNKNGAVEEISFFGIGEFDSLKGCIDDEKIRLTMDMVIGSGYIRAELKSYTVTDYSMDDPCLIRMVNGDICIMYILVIGVLPREHGIWPFYDRQTQLPILVRVK